MEYIKELFEAFASRSRSHFFGSIMISLLGLNWQPIYFVIYSDVDILERFAYFDDHVKLWLPLIIGLALALITPALTWGGTWWAEKFTTRVKIIQAGAASSVAIKEMGLENDRAAEKAKIALTVDETLGKIEDEEVRDKFREDALSGSDSSDNAIEEELKQSLSRLGKYERAILMRLRYPSDTPVFVSVDSNGNQYVKIGEQGIPRDTSLKYLRALNILEDSKYIEKINIQMNDLWSFELTSLGHKVADEGEESWNISLDEEIPF